MNELKEYFDYFDEVTKGVSLKEKEILANEYVFVIIVRAYRRNCGLKSIIDILKEYDNDTKNALFLAIIKTVNDLLNI